MIFNTESNNNFSFDVKLTFGMVIQEKAVVEKYKI